MTGVLGRLLIVNDQKVFARRIGAFAERLSFSTRILTHTLDLKYVVEHWRPGYVAVQMAMPDDEDVHVLEYLERTSFAGRLLLTGDVGKKALADAADVARSHGLAVQSVLTSASSADHAEAALKLLLRLERAA